MAFAFSERILIGSAPVLQSAHTEAPLRVRRKSIIFRQRSAFFMAWDRAFLIEPDDWWGNDNVLKANLMPVLSIFLFCLFLQQFLWSQKKEHRTSFSFLVKSPR